jgi:glycosyltransferase involved in cell wall biosynthesis
MFENPHFPPAGSGRIAALGAGGSAVPNGLSFVVHSHLRWDFVWQRPQQIFSRLARDHRVVFVEEPVDKPGYPSLAVTEAHPNVVRVVPALPGAGGMTVDAQYALLLPLLLAALKEHPLLAGRFDHPIHWFYSPMPAPCALGRLNALAVVYDCMDELANFRFAPPDISQRESVLLAAADVVFTGGYQLYQAKSRLHPNVRFYGCGVDVDHFGRARCEDLPLPGEVANLQRPVFGYFGVIDERLDYDLLARLAAHFPAASVVMVGPTAKVEPHQLPRRSNIHWLGQRPYGELPALVKSFDVCLMPFAMNEATRYINPTKTLEYMAAGKPIVSTAVPDVVRNFGPIVAVGSTRKDFLAKVRRAYEQPDAERIAQGLRRASAAGWESTVASMLRDILESVESPPDTTLAQKTAAGQHEQPAAQAMSAAMAVNDKAAL